MGLTSSFHCLGMCGPLAISLPYGGNRVDTRLLYQTGRILTYMLFGVAIGSVGHFVSLVEYQQYLSIGAGLLILVLVLAGSHRLQGWGPLNRFNGWVQGQLRRVIGRLESDRKAFFWFGLLNGALPCGVVYLALAAAVGAGSSWGGGLFMLLFGLGTWPMMWLISYGSVFAALKRFSLRNSMRYVSLGVAVLFILRGLNLGIPYVSPKFEAQTAKSSCCMKVQACPKPAP